MNIAATLFALTVVPHAGPTTLDQDYNSSAWQSNIRRGLIPYHKLTIDDFKVLDRTPSDHLAYTMGFIEYRYQAQVSGRDPYRARVVKMTIWSGLDKSLTWYKRGLGNSSEWLAHEQGHLDINELAATQFASRPISSYPVGSGRSPKGAEEDLAKEVGKYFDEFQQANLRNQARYDEQTKGGLNKVAQAQWKAYITQTIQATGIQVKWTAPAGSLVPEQVPKRFEQRRAVTDSVGISRK